MRFTKLIGPGSYGRGKIRLLVNDPVLAKRALRMAKYRFKEEPVFALRLRNKPAALARVAARLAQERINVRSIYATTAGPGSALVVLTLGGNASKVRGVLVADLGGCRDPKRSSVGTLPRSLWGMPLTGARGWRSTGDAMRHNGSSRQVRHGGRDGHATGPSSCVIGAVTGRR